MRSAAVEIGPDRHRLKLDRVASDICPLWAHRITRTPINREVFSSDDMPSISRARGAAKPHLSGSAERLMAKRRERQGQRAGRREAIVEMGAALVFLAVAGALPAVSGAPAPPPGVTIALIVAIAVVSLVEFDVGAGYAPPTQIVFVPALFLLDPVWVPLVVASGLVLGRLRDIVRDHNPERQLVVAVSNAWYAVGPALVFVLGGVNGFHWADWPLFPIALLSQFAADTVTGATREWLVLGVKPRLQLRMTGLVFLVDVLLTPIGLLGAIAAHDGSFAFLLVLPLAGLLRIFARERGARIEQAIELSAAYRGTAFLLGEVIVHDDQYTAEHSYGVIALSLEIADELGLDEDERRLVEFAALLHDVGKIAVPKEIVNKPGPLSEQEWQIMRQHTIAGQQMLDKVGGGMTDVGQIVRASHEHWDGGGYPDGKAGDAVPLPARIVAVADAFNSITTTRPYRRAQSPEAAVKELRACAGTQFDPEVVDGLIAVLARPAAETSTEFFARTAEPPPARLRVVPDLDELLDAALEDHLGPR
ncbi:MAG TPA: HD-GYP domain-containing protein [Solirubrobacteraceae bacterium]|jgi:putative nucleotidyltransferase with HDIG domain